jgi:DNA-binding transcriptional regulator YhcF (GntR family)
LKKWENGDYLPNKHDKVVKFAHLLQIDLITFDRMFRELQQERAARLPVTPAAPLVETKSALSDDEIEELVNSADRYILFTKKQVVKLIKQVEVKHGLRSDIE